MTPDLGDPVAAVPEDWSRASLGEIADFVNGRAFKPSDWVSEGIPIVRIQNLNGGTEFNYFDGEIEPRYAVNRGDLLFSWSGTRGTSFGPHFWKGPAGVLNQHIFNVRNLRGTDQKFLFYALKMITGAVEKRAHGGTGIVHITKGQLEAFLVPHPSLGEQRKIAAILSSVDEAIEATQAVIEQLQVVKKAMMAELLTRGLRGRHTRFKQTEIGEVPEEWTVRTVGDLADFVTSGSRGWAQFYSKEGALFLRSQNVRAGFIDLSDRAFVQPPDGAEGERTRLMQNDILVTITGNSVGNVAVAPEELREAYVSQHVGLIRLHQPDLASFCALYLSPGSPGNDQVLSAQYGQSKPGLNLSNLKSFRIPLPGADELGRIEALVRSIQNRVDREAAALEAVRGAKAALMSVLLTGEVRVKPDEEAA